jgi:hypothetical protein
MHLHVRRVGQISDADVKFGDLTVLVGPQAAGKSIFLQFFKLLADTGAVLAELKRYGLDWRKDAASFLDVYLGEGMSGIWRPNQSKLSFRGEDVDLETLVQRQKKKKDESMFFIPAQRVLTLGRGWPRPFTDYSPGDPFVVRDFSEKVRVGMESRIGAIGASDTMSRLTHRLKRPMRDALDATVFCGFGLRIDQHGAQKRLVLSLKPDGKSLPFMVWSAGQREFVPLLLGLYWLLPPTRTSRREKLDWVVIEEVEMGLHPRAISTALLLILDLLARDYRVCLSTHSPHVLDLVWALKVFQQHGAKADKLLELFDVESRQDLTKMADNVLTKTARVYYFNPTSGQASEISNLDPGSQDVDEAGWGGLTAFSGRVADVVANVVSSDR